MPTEVLKGPAITILVLVFIALGGVVHLLDQSELSFDKWMTTSLAAAAVLGLGRGLAAKGDVTTGKTGLEKWLEEGNVATVLLFIFAAVGIVGVVAGDDGAMDWEGLFQRVLAAAVVLGVGRGIAAFKKDRDAVLRGESDPNYQRHLAAERGAVAAGLTGEPEGAVRGKPGLQQ